MGRSKQRDEACGSDRQQQREKLLRRSSLVARRSLQEREREREGERERAGGSRHNIHLSACVAVSTFSARSLSLAAGISLGSITAFNMVKQQHHQQEDRPTGKDEWHEVNGVKFRYEAEETGGGGSGGSGSSPNTLQLAVPVFYATEEDVRCDFEKFIVKIESVLEKYGVGKVVPPKSWAPAAPKVEGSSSLGK